MKLRPLRPSRTGPGEGGWGGGFRVEVGCGPNKGLERAETPAWAPSAAGRPDPGGLDSWWDGSPCRISGGERRDELRSLMGSPAHQAPCPAQLSSQPLRQPAGGPLRMPGLARPWPQEQERTLLPGTPRGWRRRHGAVLNSGPGESADQASLQRLLCLPGNFPQAPAVCQRALAVTTRRLPVPTRQAGEGRTLGLPRAREEARLREVKPLPQVTGSPVSCSINQEGHSIPTPPPGD